MDECDKVNPHLRDLCRCERAGQTLDGCNRRRVAWGVAPRLSMPGEPEPEQPPEPRPLTAFEKIRSFASVSIQTVFRHIVWGDGFLSEEEMQPRLDACNNCEALVDGVCRYCGCACKKESKVNFMNKIACRAADCPLKKWPKC